jgi:hypothetical protein
MTGIRRWVFHEMLGSPSGDETATTKWGSCLSPRALAKLLSRLPNFAIDMIYDDDDDESTPFRE